jgi:pentatricopeptide repeat protein
VLYHTRPHPAPLNKKIGVGIMFQKHHPNGKKRKSDSLLLTDSDHPDSSPKKNMKKKKSSSKSNQARLSIKHSTSPKDAHSSTRQHQSRQLLPLVVDHQQKQRTQRRSSTVNCQRNQHPQKPQKPTNRSSSSGPPSQEALELSSQLKQLSREKKWKEALQLYHDTSLDDIRDGHHACIMVDLAARCGRISEGERIVQELQDQKKCISVELQTALLKGFAHGGDMAKVDDLFHRMCLSHQVVKAKQQPNVRTLNTVLRGCLWSAASVASDGKTIVGGVVTAERAWSVYQNMKRHHQEPVLDVSSFEYSIKLLCQALRTNDAKKRIQEMKRTFGISQNDAKGSDQSNDQSMTETLAVVYLALGQAHAIRNEVKECMEACTLAVTFASHSKKALKCSTSFSSKHTHTHSHKNVQEIQS